MTFPGEVITTALLGAIAVCAWRCVTQLTRLARAQERAAAHLDDIRALLWRFPQEGGPQR